MRRSSATLTRSKLRERLTDTVSQSYSFPTAPQPQLPLVHVWPDANEVGRVWRPDLGIVSDPQAVIRGLLKLGAPKDAAKRKGWGAHGHVKDASSTDIARK